MKKAESQKQNFIENVEGLEYIAGTANYRWWRFEYTI